MQNLLQISLKHILMNITTFMGVSDTLRMLYNASFLTES
jgi:hypothetical protein